MDTKVTSSSGSPCFSADCFKANSNLSSWDQAMERGCAPLQSPVAKYFIFLSWSMFGFFIVHFTSSLISTVFSPSQFAGYSTCFNKSMISECGWGVQNLHSRDVAAWSRIGSVSRSAKLGFSSSRWPSDSLKLSSYTDSIESSVGSGS